MVRTLAEIRNGTPPALPNRTPPMLTNQDRFYKWGARFFMVATVLLVLYAIKTLIGGFTGSGGVYPNTNYFNGFGNRIWPG